LLTYFLSFAVLAAAFIFKDQAESNIFDVFKGWKDISPPQHSEFHLNTWKEV